MKFGKYELEDLVHPIGGEMYRVFFPNGYGASIVRFRVSSGFGGSYGVEQGLYEMAVLKGDSDNSSLTYETPITNDVIGHLTPDEVGEKIDEVQSLEPKVKNDA